MSENIVKVDNQPKVKFFFIKHSCGFDISNNFCQNLMKYITQCVYHPFDK